MGRAIWRGAVFASMEVAASKASALGRLEGGHGELSPFQEGRIQPGATRREGVTRERPLRRKPQVFPGSLPAFLPGPLPGPVDGAHVSGLVNGIRALRSIESVGKCNGGCDWRCDSVHRDAVTVWCGTIGVVSDRDNCDQAAVQIATAGLSSS